ncbi:MAG: hypothetical protein HOC63_00400 [Rhodospirillales bacterium]|jgi:hypothetical protein|nr:hypothetical protein [Rhodospirillales bacterium]MBT4625122.1 hypothetical protein [Rhodospirillales bacterium]MBT5353326.1 hypothetical protein [Rhodospirillales bacterium]MBT5520159.1 hypothetical protein [Rhodospirillales bacterium]MBT6109223.1 hypothetical protein [Rhodospirillales bacterium]
MSLRKAFYDKGWCRFPDDPAILAWVDHALPAARTAIASPVNDDWLRCDGTWHVGVNVLPNDEAGQLVGGPPLQGEAISFVFENIRPSGFQWDRGQVSVCYPGYPRRMDDESENAFSFRRNRDAAHVDGLRREDNTRRLCEFHGFVLGIPLVNTSADASPFVVWEGSHEIIRRGFTSLYEGMPPEDWGQIDVTDAYKHMRREVFETCKRVEVAANPGQVYVTHRLTVHGVAPWVDHATAGPDGRMIAYFRPDFGDAEGWLSAP